MVLKTQAEQIVIVIIQLFLNHQWNCAGRPYRRFGQNQFRETKPQQFAIYYLLW